MKEKKKEQDEPELTFEEVMRKIICVPKEKVEEAIKAGKKKPRGKFVKNG